MTETILYRVTLRKMKDLKKHRSFKLIQTVLHPVHQEMTAQRQFAFIVSEDEMLLFRLAHSDSIAEINKIRIISAPEPRSDGL